MSRPPILIMDDARLGRIKFRAWRRGFREADLILGPFADRFAPTMTVSELDHFEALLDEPDRDLYAWIVGTDPAPARVDGALLERLRAFRPWAQDGAARGG